MGAEKAYRLATRNNKARMVFVTKMDLENADYFKILEQLKIEFGPTICPCVVPARLDDGTVAYINLFSKKAFKYESGKQIQIDLPDIGHRFEGLIQAMNEAIAETDEALMEKFFEGRSSPPRRSSPAWPPACAPARSRRSSAAAPSTSRRWTCCFTT